MLGVAQEMFDFDSDIIGEVGKFRVQGLHQRDGMTDAVEKIWIAKGHVLGPSRNLLSNVLYDHITLHDAKAPGIHWHNWAMATQVFTATARFRVASRALLLWPHDELGIGEWRREFLAIRHQKLLALQRNHRLRLWCCVWLPVL